MGNSDSVFLSTNVHSWTNPELVPKVSDLPKFDPNYGFQEPREQRTTKYTEQDYYNARIPPIARDYCADILIDYQRCRRDNFPFFGRCAHTKHEWSNCQNEDALYRMKEFERERRLLERENRKKKALNQESLNDLE